MGDEWDSQQKYLGERFERFGQERFQDGREINVGNRIIQQDYIRWLADEYYVIRPLSVVMKEGLVKFDKDKIRKQRGGKENGGV